jgi:CheY-like chemotaxis protein
MSAMYSTFGLDNANCNAGLRLAGGAVISTSSIPKQTILCIDNDEFMLRWKRRSGRVWPRRSQRSVTEQALRLVITYQCDAVLPDYEMPVMSGYEVAFEIKHLRLDPVVIMLSGSEVTARKVSMVDAFIPKLEQTRELLPMIAEPCGRNRDALHKGKGR